jgi:hypothetical protein
LGNTVYSIELVDVTTVKIVAIGYKEHNDLFIRDWRVKL